MAAEQSSLELKGRSSDPVMDRIREHPERVLRFRYVEHPGYFKIDLLGPGGEDLGISTVASKVMLAASERWDRG